MKVCVVVWVPIVAVIVTEVGEVTWPGVKLNSAQELVAGTGTDAGKGAACEFELERFTVAPPAGAPLLSCRSTNTCRPLVGVVWVRVIVFTCSGPSGTTNVPVCDHAVTAAVPAVSITPCDEFTRQNFVPAVGSWMIV